MGIDSAWRLLNVGHADTSSEVLFKTTRLVQGILNRHAALLKIQLRYRMRLDKRNGPRGPTKKNRKGAPAAATRAARRTARETCSIKLLPLHRASNVAQDLLYLECEFVHAMLKNVPFEAAVTGTKHNSVACAAEATTRPFITYCEVAPRWSRRTSGAPSFRPRPCRRVCRSRYILCPCQSVPTRVPCPCWAYLR